MFCNSIPERPHFELEAMVREKNMWPVAGIDEVGRGALAGPVVVAAIILDPNNIPFGINDSKKISHKKREELYEKITSSAIISISSASHQYIDKHNIHKATLDAIYHAVENLQVIPRSALIDGRSIPEDLPCQAFAVIKGDSISLSIAAASIIAKVTRDRLMRIAHKKYPDYGFDSHVGYPTAKHQQVIKEKGPSCIHRLTFRPLRNLSV
ncbi:ribonuclease HII [Candidatus Liberibacter asiaticus]|uniref:Ribonuclease HII n=2 Tax=Liberibacter asiaticus TaxID=34021 RepID=C6XGP6_LIBAP|nr:ribonuclease HII [Candidatus Liberibacter asiaticus]ACT57549.1 ribonuclease HII [Candidatus Liberibacter asiaticus str. psy62]AGH17312.1 ribonuclease HII [Candidatus Liberibacter asiaticus str. gxpsy]ALK07598.1 ribonuclease HII [Candidatus Liberibacter asiaticus]ASK53088.1 ribonuclease HII [Candidatus Liberibacter asiaticus]AWL14413.1 ribonuclease HII [Candidatus Liberibacter asiaticus]